MIQLTDEQKSLYLEVLALFLDWKEHTGLYQTEFTLMSANTCFIAHWNGTRVTAVYTIAAMGTWLGEEMGRSHKDIVWYVVNAHKTILTPMYIHNTTYEILRSPLFAAFERNRYMIVDPTQRMNVPYCVIKVQDYGYITMPAQDVYLLHGEKGSQGIEMLDPAPHLL